MKRKNFTGASYDEDETSDEDDYDYDEDDGNEDSYSEENYDSDEDSSSEDAGYDSDEEEESSSESSSESGKYLGNFKLTAYCNCARCCGTAGNPTASGSMPVEGRTVAMEGLDFGTKLLIDGNIYTVEDRGTPYGHVDIYMDSHDACLDFGVQYADVYLVG